MLSERNQHSPLNINATASGETVHHFLGYSVSQSIFFLSSALNGFISLPHEEKNVLMSKLKAFADDDLDSLHKKLKRWNQSFDRIEIMVENGESAVYNIVYKGFIFTVVKIRKCLV